MDTSSIGKVADALRGCVGKTQAEMALAMTQAVFPPNHPEVLFAQWMVDNKGHIIDACIELGVKPPEEGPDLYIRLKDTVMSALASKQGE